MNQPPSTRDNSKGDRPSDKLLPFQPVRQETVLSKLPVHNLSKKGSISIHISRKTKDGLVDLLWRVSPSRDYGEPRQLAYKLDTLVINRRLDEMPKPFPQTIQLGSLRHLSKQLGLRRGDTADIKTALHQNAGAYITAKLNYKGNDGSEHHLEAGFTRYTVIFKGEKLPDGKRADSVYIELHPRYQEVLNNAPTRPLNYDYLKELPPAAQRFYEIISYRIFATLTNSRPHATITYSEYCQYSAQKRNYQLWQIKRQMTPIHRLHIQSGYIDKVWYEETTDPESNPDWFMYYIPGPKARTEYETFTRKKLPEPQPPIEPQKDDGEVGEPLSPEPNPAHIKALTDRGVSTAVASRIATAFSGDFDLQLAYIDDRVEQKRTQGILENAPGLYISGFGLDKNGKPWEVSPDFKASYHHRQQQQVEEERRELETAYYSSYVAPAIDAWIKENPTEYQKLLATARQNPENAKSAHPEVTKHLATYEARRRIGDKLNLQPLDEWRQSKEVDNQPPQPDAPRRVSALTSPPAK